MDELVDWVGHSPEKLEAMRSRLDSLRRAGTGQIDGVADHRPGP